MQFSLQALINKGLVEKGKFRTRGDDGYQHSTFGLTVMGRASLKLMVACLGSSEPCAAILFRIVPMYACSMPDNFNCRPEGVVVFHLE